MCDYIYKTLLTVVVGLLFNTQIFGQFWERAYPINNHAISYDVATSPDSSLLVVGVTLDSVSSEYECFLMKTDFQGNVLWMHQGDIPLGYIYIDEVLDTIIVYSIYANDSLFNASIFDIDGNFIRLDSFNMPLRTIGNNRCIRRSIDNNYLVIGDVYEDSLYNKTDLAVVKVDLAGEVIWYYQPSEPGIQQGHAILSLDDGGVIFMSTDDDASTLLTKLDIDGQILWEKEIGRCIKCKAAFLNYISKRNIVKQPHGFPVSWRMKAPFVQAY